MRVGLDGCKILHLAGFLVVTQNNPAGFIPLCGRCVLASTINLYIKSFDLMSCMRFIYISRDRSCLPAVHSQNAPFSIGD
jgi:hypothetical protein